jgi:ATP-dependent exoDNAse (exonuclease V) alpha subunit
MAIFHFAIRPISRKNGQQATGAAAYRAGESIRDERTGDRHNFARRTDVRHKEIFLPSRLKDEAGMEWARDRAALWNAAEDREKRRDARTAREFEAALPSELSHEQRLELARKYSVEVADRYGVAVDLAVHDPKPGRESDNYHAHLLMTTREVTPKGLGEKAGLDISTAVRDERGLVSHRDEYVALRERWATLTNEALREAGLETRVDHRALAAQGFDRQPMVRIPMELYQLERLGVDKEAAEKLREDYRAKIAAYREETRETKVAEVNAAESKTKDEPEAQVAAPEPTPTRDPEEIRRRAVQEWLQMRSGAAAKGAESTPTQDASHDNNSAHEVDKGRDR